MAKKSIMADKLNPLHYRTLHDKDPEKPKINVKHNEADSTFRETFNFKNEDFINRTTPNMSVSIKTLMKRKKDGRPKIVE